MTTQNKELFKQFVEFCDNQPKYKDINHMLWSTCAVGEFLSSTGIELADHANTSNTPVIMWVLGNGSLFSLINTRSSPERYGDFTLFLKEYL